MEEKKQIGITEKRLLSACVFLAIAGVLLVLSRWIPGFAEGYSVLVYAGVTAVLGRVTGLMPFSVAEFGLYVSVGLLLGTAVHAAVKAVRTGRGADAALRWSSGLFLTAAVLFFLYVANCGINYRRISFSEKAGIITAQHSVQDLKEVCIWLTEEVNARVGLVERNAEGEMVLGVREGSGTEEDPGKAAVESMIRLSGEYPDLNGFYPEPKPVIVSEILSFQGLTGIYSPFTIEANYNRDMPDYNIPFTACHELSHLRGFMQEEEANFIAFLACSESERTDFQYSGYLTAWVYSMNALYRMQTQYWEEVREQLREEADTDLLANSQFWNYYDGAVARVSDKVNDTYLKVNGQSAGVKSYGRMVDLLIAYAGQESFR